MAATKVVVISVSMAIVSAEFFSCNWVQQAFVDCSRYQPMTFCATNKVTYDNNCYFSQAHCADNSIDLLHLGGCTDIDFTTPPPVDGGMVVFDFFCRELSHRDCPADDSPVCATNKVTYKNLCEYEKYKCFHPEVHVDAYGSCI